MHRTIPPSGELAERAASTASSRHVGPFIALWKPTHASDRLRGSAVVRSLAALLAVGLVLGCQQILWACPTCKDGLAQNDPLGASLVQGYFWSILFMMSMPFLIISALGGYFYYEVRKARARQAQPDLEPSVE